MHYLNDPEEIFAERRFSENLYSSLNQQVERTVVEDHELKLFSKKRLLRARRGPERIV